MVLDRIALILVIVGALNWGLIGPGSGGFFLWRPDGGALPDRLLPGGARGPVVRLPALPGARSRRGGGVSGPPARSRPRPLGGGPDFK